MLSLDGLSHRRSYEECSKERLFYLGMMKEGKQEMKEGCMSE